MCRALGVGEITAHGLRHSAATILVNQVGKDLRGIQELLRHKNIRTTVRYTLVGYERTRRPKPSVRLWSENAAEGTTHRVLLERLTAADGGAPAFPLAYAYRLQAHLAQIDRLATLRRRPRNLAQLALAVYSGPHDPAEHVRESQHRTEGKDAGGPAVYGH